MTAVVVLPQNGRNYAVTIVNADASNLKTIATAAGTFLEINALQATSDDTSDRLLQLILTVGGTDYLIGTVNVPTLSGTTATAAAVDLLGSSNLKLPIYDANNNKLLRLDAASVLKVKSTTTVTANKTVTITAIGSEY